jgi:orotidine-5'-phosphate decarboxylase
LTETRTAPTNPEGAAPTTSAAERLIVALDVATADEAREAFAALRGTAGMFKIGSQLFTAEGPSLVRELRAAGARLFLDLKFHDIPNTVAAASREAVRLGASIFDLHAAGGSEMMRRAAEAANEEAARLGVEPPLLVGVTVLTSADRATLEETGIGDVSIERQVARLARLAAESGLGGVVASPHEIGLVRAAAGRTDFAVVTPGVRPASVSHDDQKRVMTPGEAVRAGADYIVVGRAILKAPDPTRAAREIVAEMKEALASV